jgi:hypothetical protein
MGVDIKATWKAESVCACKLQHYRITPSLSYQKYQPKKNYDSFWLWYQFVNDVQYLPWELWGGGYLSLKHCAGTNWE